MTTAAARRPPQRAEERQLPRSWSPFAVADAEVWIVLAVAMVLAAVVGLWLGRDTTFAPDEIAIFTLTPHLDFRAAIEPYNGHLVAIPRLVEALLLHAFGADYLPVRVVGIATVLLTAGLFFTFAKRRVGPIVALAPTLVLLVYGGDYQHGVAGNGFGVLFPIAAGIGALLALDRDDAAGDVAACLLLIAGLASYSDALAFLAGVAVLILLSPDRVRRAWVWLIPAALYGAWFLWSRGQGGHSAESYVAVHNLLLVPIWAFDSLANLGASLVGLRYPAFGTDWGPVIALIGIAALAWRLRMGRVPIWLWALMAIPLTLWIIEAAAAAPPSRVPQQIRYFYPGSIAVLLVAAEAARRARLDRKAVLILYGVTVVSLLTNLALLRDGSAALRDMAATARTDLAAVDIARGHLGQSQQGGFRGLVQAALAAPPAVAEAAVGDFRLTRQNSVATGYLEAVREFGSPGFSPTELRAQNESLREQADADLADELGVQLAPAAAPRAPCRREGASRGATFKVPPGGAILQTSGPRAKLYLRRFGTAFTVDAGTLAPARWLALRAPLGSAPDPWYATSASGPLRICAR